MAKQTINVGITANDRTGDPLRIAFTKVNENFTEVYNSVENISVEVDRSWESANSGIFNVVEWNSGKDITITATPYETANAVTYDTRSDSEYIYLVWDQDFIDNVWNGYNTPAGEGQSYSISLDGGDTWIPVTTSGYSNNTSFYFWIPTEQQGNYLFNYTIGQNVLIQYNRGSNLEVWFDINDSPISANNVVAVDMSATIIATIPGDPDLTATIFKPNIRFTNALYDDNTGAGGLNDGADVWYGSDFVQGEVNMDVRKSDDPLDAGRIYANFDDGNVGTMTFYWNARLYTVT